MTDGARRAGMLLGFLFVSATPAQTTVLDAAPTADGAWVGLTLPEPLDRPPTEAGDGAWLFEGLSPAEPLTVGARWPLLRVMLSPAPEGARLTVETAPGEWSWRWELSDDQPFARLWLEPARPVAEAATLLPPRDRPWRVVLDPGHGGRPWTGAAGVSSGVFEKELVLELARRVGELLTAEGIEVRLTREADTAVGLRERARSAREFAADLFLSLHLNGGPPGENGAEMYIRSYSRPESPWPFSGPLEPLPLDGTLPLATRLEAAYGLARLTDEELSAPSRSLAEALLTEHAALGLAERGVKTAPFYVLVEQRTPAVLLESAFLSNRDDEARLLDPLFREELARAVARGILRWFEDRERLLTPPAAPDTNALWEVVP